MEDNLAKVVELISSKGFVELVKVPTRSESGAWTGEFRVYMHATGVLLGLKMYKCIGDVKFRLDSLRIQVNSLEPVKPGNAGLSTSLCGMKSKTVLKCDQVSGELNDFLRVATGRPLTLGAWLCCHYEAVPALESQEFQKRNMERYETMPEWVKRLIVMK